MNIGKINIDKWLPHIIGLMLFLILPLFVFEREQSRAMFWMYSYYYQLVFMVIAFYVNYLIIVPRYFFTSKRVCFFIILLAFTVLLIFLSQFFYNVIGFDSLRREQLPELSPGKPKGFLGLHPKIIDNFFLLVLVLGFSTGMAIIQRFKQKDNEQKEVEKARLNSELAFLKNQISPHFFFNSLNNIYALIAIDSDKAQQAVEKLSGLMRYLIYDSDIEKVELQKEFDFTQNYIELMRQRVSSKVKLDVDISENIPSVEIPPLIFIPFIENAFKHGISYRDKSYISISLKANANSVLFKCRNSIPKNINETENAKGGVGIVNIKKRLELIYGEQADLTMEDDGKEFSVILTIPLNVNE